MAIKLNLVFFGSIQLKMMNFLCERKKILWRTFLNWEFGVQKNELFVINWMEAYSRHCIMSPSFFKAWRSPWSFFTFHIFQRGLHSHIGVRHPIGGQAFPHRAMSFALQRMMRTMKVRFLLKKFAKRWRTRVRCFRMDVSRLKHNNWQISTQVRFSPSDDCGLSFADKDSCFLFEGLEFPKEYEAFSPKIWRVERKDWPFPIKVRKIVIKGVQFPMNSWRKVT